MIKTILLIAYLFCVLPLLIGECVLYTIRHDFSFRLHGLAFSYVFGYIIYLALFELTVLWQTYRSADYMPLVQSWKQIVIVVTIISIIWLAFFLFIIIIKNRTHGKKWLSFLLGGTFKKTLALTMLILTLLSVLFLVPHSMDETPELARLTIKNDCFFSINPLTGTMYAENDIYPGKIHLFFAFGSTLTGIDVTTLIHRFIPIFMIPLFVCSYVVITELLLCGDKWDQARFLLFKIIMLFYLTVLPFETHISVAVYRNIWNGTTFASSCLLPLLFGVCVDFVRKSRLHTSVLSSQETLIGIICLSLAVHLCVPYGLPICGVLLLASVIIMLFSNIRLKRLSDKAMMKGCDFS